MVGDTIWLFGLPCSGKTTLAKGLIGSRTVHLDGDYLRDTLNTDLGFSKEDRTENLRRAAGIAEGLNEQGFDVVASFITPYKSQREMIHEKVSSVKFIHVKTPIDVCKKRDVKGMYELAREGEIENFTGVDAPFEEPEQEEDVLEVQTEKHSAKESLKKINTELNRKSDQTYVFLGRWQPLHDGHRTIIDSAADNGEKIVIGIRDTELSEKNPFTAQERKELITNVYSDYPNVEVMIVPDIDTVAIGRDVGYSIISVPEEIAEISGTKTRKEYKKSELLAGKHFSD